MLLLTKNIKISVFARICLAACLFLCCAMQAEGQNSWAREHQAARNMVNEERMMLDISFLSDSLCQGRATGTRGGAEAAFWVERQFRRSGLLPFDDTYSKHVWVGKGLVGHNVIGMFPGSIKSPCNKYIIVGAHYDHIGVLDGKMYPGADSNASGTVALTVLADMFAAMTATGQTYDTNIIFVAFDAKEMNMTGSESFWRMIENEELNDPLTGAPVTPEKIQLMVNIDQIGSTLSPIRRRRPDYMIMLGTESLKPIKREMLDICNRLYGTYLDIGLSYYGSEQFTRIFYRLSDQKVFVDNGIPAVMFTSGITMNNNKTRDTAQTLDMEILRKRIYLIYHWIDRML